MAEPFIFHFSAGKLGGPEVMYIADLKCACTLCKHPQLQRFYHATNLHTLTWAGLHHLAKTLPEKVDYTCENCGTPSSPEFVLASTLIYGSPDHTYELYLYTNHQQSNRRQYQLKLGRRLDPQIQPRFTPEEDAQHLFDVLDEETFELLTKRVFNTKLAIVELIDSWLDAPDGGAYTCLAPDLWVFVDQSQSQVNDLVDHVIAINPDLDEMYGISLTDSVPYTLPTHAFVETMPGHWRTWFEPDVLELIESGKCCVEMLVSQPSAMDAVTQAFQTARLTYTVGEDQEMGPVLENIMTPRDEPYAKSLYLDDVLRRAVYTGLTPGTSGRLSAEEIVGLLLQVWHD